MRALHYISMVVIVVALLSACTPDSENKSNEGLNIYTSIYPIQYITKQIVGDTAVVEPIYPNGVDAHTYEPSSKDITKLARSDAFIYLGAGMESFTDAVTESLESQNVAFIEIGKHTDLFSKHDPVEDEQNMNDGHGHHDVDPHIWLDPLRMIQMANIITEELGALNPENASLFKENLSYFEQSMKDLDHLFKETLSNKNNPEIMVTHAAYGYWEDSYGIKQLPISGISSSDEPSQKELADITRIAKQKSIHYIIFESNSSNRIAEIIQDHIDADKLFIHSLEVLTEEEINNGEDYLSLMKENIKVLDKATN